MNDYFESDILLLKMIILLTFNINVQVLFDTDWKGLFLMTSQFDITDLKAELKEDLTSFQRK